MAAREIVVNMVPGGVTPVIHVSQYDDGYGITANLIENSGTYTVPVGATVSIEGTKPDGHGYSYLCTYQDNAVVIPINTQMTAVKGEYACELVVRKEGLRVGSKNVIMAVENAGLAEDTIISDTELPAIIALAQEQEEAAATSATEAAASATSAETSKNAAIDAAQDAIEAAQELQTAVQWNATVIKEEASGAIAHIPDGSDNIPMQSVVASFSPIQSGTGGPSPSNIRPISGRTGLTVVRSGKNLCPRIPSVSKQGLNYVLNDDGTVTVTGTATANSYAFVDTDLTFDEDVIMSGCPDPNPSPNNIRIQVVAGGTNYDDYGGGVTIPAGKNITQIRLRIYNGTTAGGCVFKPMLRFASDSADYEPYIGTEIPITWESIAGTVYGGTLDVVSGVLTVDRALYTAKWGDGLASTIIGGFDRRRYNATPVVNMDRRAEAVCNIAPYGTGYATGGLKFIIDASVTTATRFYVYLPEGQVDDTQDIQIAWAIQPQTYQLTPQEIRTLLGVNNMWGDGDSMDVTYVADTKMYIDNKIAALQALVLENN